MSSEDSFGASRRGVLAVAGGVSLGVMLPWRTAHAEARPVFDNYPFSLGVASGDPLPDGVVLWTRLAPDPLAGGGMPDQPVPVQWQVAADDGMRRVVRAGAEVARPEWAHSVHVEVDGLEADREYFYQFRVGTEVSPIGRTATTPAVDAQPQSMAFAFVSCQNRPNGFYAAYRHLAGQELDFVVHLGDYIYEGGFQGDLGRGHVPARAVFSLDDYRTRYAQYKTDPDLQAAHAAAPWFVTLDDHDLVDNWHGENTDPAFLERRAAALQAMYEHQPLRRSSMPDGIDMALYRRWDYGDLAQVSLLDTRQYRSALACGGGFGPLCEEAFDPGRTMTGPEQEQWLLANLDSSPARWNVIAQQVYMVGMDLEPGPEERRNMDKWEAYPAARRRLVDFVDQRRPVNPVVVSGDVHATMVNDLHVDVTEPESEVIATEFVGTSISSDKANNPMFETALPENPQVKFYNGRQRGYVRCEVTPELWRSDLLFVDDVTDPASAVRTEASYVVEDGRPGALAD